MQIFRMQQRPQASLLLLLLLLGFALPTHADNKVRDWEQGSYREGRKLKLMKTKMTFIAPSKKG